MFKICFSSIRARAFSQKAASHRINFDFILCPLKSVFLWQKRLLRWSLCDRDNLLCTFSSCSFLCHFSDISKTPLFKTLKKLVNQCLFLGTVRAQPLTAVIIIFSKSFPSAFLWILAASLWNCLKLRGYKTRAVINQERLMVARVRYLLSTRSPPYYLPSRYVHSLHW